MNSSLNDSTTNESFNFGSLNGVRGFFTDSSRGADTFIPFSGVTYLIRNGEKVSADVKAINSTGEYEIMTDYIGKNYYVNTAGKSMCFKIDLSKYKKIIISARCNNGNNQFDAGVYSSPSDIETYSSGSCIDVSSFTGEKYVCARYLSGRVHIYDIIGIT